MDDSDRVLYPNADASRRRRPGLSRRRLLASSAVAGVTATAGCSQSETTPTDGNAETQPTVFVFNTGDGTVSLIDADRDEVIRTVELGLTSSFPSNQYTPRLADSPDDALWLNVGRGVRGLGVESLSERATVETGSGANWLEQTPDGRHVVVSAREPAHTNYRIDADPDSERFGEVTAELDRTAEGGRGDNAGPGPCDVTIHPEGRYAYVPDLFGDTLTVLDVDSFEIATQIGVDPVGSGPASPWMGTVAWDGATLLVEHNEGPNGTESIWDLDDPANPTERLRLTADDGLGERPLTSEIGPDSETGYVFTPGSADLTVIDLVAGEVADRIDLGGDAFVGTWGPAREKLYVPIQTGDEVVVLDHASGEIATRLPVGASPYGATAARLRPRTDPAAEVGAQFARLGVGTDGETTYCLGNCACGHEL